MSYMVKLLFGEKSDSLCVYILSHEAICIMWVAVKKV